MKQITSLDIPVSDIMKNLTLTVRITETRVLSVRLFAAKIFIRLAAYCLGCAVKVDVL
jgi:hypothetical protein